MGSTDKDDGTSFARIRFCKECNNMMYPKPDQEHKVLMYGCRHCWYIEDSPDNKCIYINKIVREVDEMTLIVSDVVEDPTLPRAKSFVCTKCGNDATVYFQPHGLSSEETMRPFYVCTNRRCCHRWVTPTKTESAESPPGATHDHGKSSDFKF